LFCNIFPYSYMNKHFKSMASCFDPVMQLYIHLMVKPEPVFQAMPSVGIKLWGCCD
jgi:hypothetical protein